MAATYDQPAVEEEPQAFVKWGQMPRVLEQANGNGVRCTLLLKSDGSLLSKAGDEGRENVIVGALVANLWEVYGEGARTSFGAGDLRTVLVNCEDGVLAVRRVGRFLVCLDAEIDVPAGALRAKLNGLAAELEEPLGKVFPQN